MANFTEGLEKLAFLDEKQLPILSVSTNNGEIKFSMYGSTTEFRVRTLFAKEPETITWIDSINPSETFWDIGANIGCYSLYAAKKGIKVHAFEPSPINFALLSRNIYINSFDNIIAFPFALSDKSEIFFWQPNVIAGSADNQLLSAGNSSCVQSYRIFDLVSIDGVSFPNHIKIDVDGIEYLIIEGCKNVLSDKRLKSILCEVNESNIEETNKIVQLMIDNGFQMPIKRHAPYFDNYHYAPHFNYLFKRG